MMMTFTEVKCGKVCAMATIFGHELLMQVKNDDLHGGQRSTEAKQ